MPFTYIQLIQLMNAIICVESSGNDMAVGYQDGEPIAFGCMQITDGYREDVNKACRTNYTRQDCFDRVKSKRMFYDYMCIYATEERIEGKIYFWHLASIHRKGPWGFKTVTGIDYWLEKVEPEYNILKELPVITLAQ